MRETKKKEEMIYRIREVMDNNEKTEYRLGRNRIHIPEYHPIYPYLPSLIYNGESDLLAFQMLKQLLSDCDDNLSPAGVYIIKSKYIHDEVVQYVGQSVVVDTRLKKHQQGVEISRALIDGELDPEIEWPVPLMYKRLRMLEMDGNDLFYEKICLPQMLYNDCYRYDKRNSLKPGQTLGVVLTILEQFLMDNLQPALNAENAIPTGRK